VSNFYKDQLIKCYQIPTTHALVLLLEQLRLTFEECTPQVEISYVTYVVPVQNQQLIKQIPKTVSQTRLSIQDSRTLRA
jgi:hypothetical protein